MILMTIDSGTTTCRVRISDESGILGSSVMQVGAKDVAAAGNNGILRKAIRDNIRDVLHMCSLQPRQIDAVIASGMITSNVGLLEIPPVEGPIALSDLGQRLVPYYASDLFHRPIWLVPGISSGAQDASFYEMDVMRGEETEVLGCFALERMEEQWNEKSILFMHFGSHHKAIAVRNGVVLKSMTTLTGELAEAVLQKTVLQSSLLPLSECLPIEEWVKEGVEAARAHGLGRLLFLTRVLDRMLNLSAQQTSSFFLGALLAQDLDVIERLIQQYEGVEIILYGKPLFPSMATSFLEGRYPSVTMRSITGEQAEHLSIWGARKLYQTMMRGRENPK